MRNQSRYNRSMLGTIFWSFLKNIYKLYIIFIFWHSYIFGHKYVKRYRDSLQYFENIVNVDFLRIINSVSCLSFCYIAICRYNRYSEGSFPFLTDLNNIGTIFKIQYVTLHLKTDLDDFFIVGKGHFSCSHI